jgi:inner membrane protein
VPTIFTHPAIALLEPWFSRTPRNVIAIGAIAAILPDADVIAFKLGIPYASMWGHRDARSPFPLPLRDLPLPWRPIRVSVIGTRFFSARAIATVLSEVRWVWVPCAVAGLAGKYFRHVEREVRQKR